MRYDKRTSERLTTPNKCLTLKYKHTISFFRSSNLFNNDPHNAAKYRTRSVISSMNTPIYIKLYSKGDLQTMSEGKMTPNDQFYVVISSKRNEKIEQQYHKRKKKFKIIEETRLKVTNSGKRSAIACKKPYFAL